MLTKKAAKAMSNTNLIHRLCALMYSSRVYKCDIEEAQRICSELEDRGVIESSEELMSKWEITYRM